MPYAYYAYVSNAYADATLTRLKRLFTFMFTTLALLTTSALTTLTLI